METGGRWTNFLKSWFQNASTKELSEKLENERVKELKRQQLKFYETYLENLASESSSDLFCNGGVEYASILMSVLLKNTKNIVRIYCKGFRPNLITREPYWSALKKYLEESRHQIMVLIQSSDCIEQRPLRYLQKIKEERRAKNHEDNTIMVKRISPQARSEISKIYGQDCNFAVFDDDKFRYEYDPEGFKAYGSFNQPETCGKLATVFDKIFQDENSVVVF